MKFVINWAVLILFFAPFAQAQREQKNEKKADGYSEPESYLLLSSGGGYYQYRDLATSPLFYSGPGLDLSLAWHREKSKGEKTFLLATSFGIPNAQMASNTGFAVKSSAMFSHSTLSYSHLHNISKWNKGKWKFWAGGNLTNSFNVRMNKSLGNNAVGIEAFVNLMASFKVGYDLSHERSGTRKILFIFDREISPKKQFAHFKLNAGLLNWNYRPGYAYKEMPELDGTKTNPFQFAFAGYDWSRNGYRLGTELSFTKFNVSGNAVQWAYLWDAIHAPGRFEPFQMAMHRIKFTLFFNRK